MGTQCTKASSSANSVALEKGSGNADSSAQAWGMFGAEKQTHVLKATPGTLLASARIRRGDILEWYTFDSRILGIGFSGPVRLAIHKQSGRKYAVKPFSKLGTTKDKVNMIRNEAQIFLRLDHPHITRLIEIWESKAHVHLVMEYCSGGELYDRLCARKLYSEAAARHVASQMFSAISYLHAHNIVHRDLKLENWLYQNMEEYANLKLVDFGFAKIWSAKSKRINATCGTLAYVSPDTLLGGYTNSCDLWSLGVSIYMLLVGYPPFYGSEEEMFGRILEGQYSLSGTRWERISPVCKDFVRRLLQKEPSKRMTASEALRHPWLATLSMTTIPSLDPAVVLSLRRFATLSRFQRAALSLMAFSLTSEQVCDRSKEGTIDFEELRFILKHNCNISSRETEKIFKSLNTLGNEEICFSEFLAAMLVDLLKNDRKLLRQTFLKFDIESLGYISFDNIRHILGDHYSFKQLSSMFSEADKDGNGLIDFEEFVKLMMGCTDLLSLPQLQNPSESTVDDQSGTRQSDGKSKSKETSMSLMGSEQTPTSDGSEVTVSTNQEIHKEETFPQEDNKGKTSTRRQKEARDLLKQSQVPKMTSATAVVNEITVLISDTPQGKSKNLAVPPDTRILARAAN